MDFMGRDARAGKISFFDGTVLDNRLFHSYVWNKMHELAFDKKCKNIMLDFYNIKLIKSEVLPKLCSLGFIAKEMDISIEINLNPISDVKDYLGTIGFYEVARNNGLFRLQDGQTGGKNRQDKLTKVFMCFEMDGIIKKYEEKFVFNKKMGPEEKLKYCIEGEIFGESYLLRPGMITEGMISRSKVLSVLDGVLKGRFDKYEYLNNLGLDFTEMIHNALWYGRTPCFFSVQAGTYRNWKTDERFRRVDFCVADSGRGLFETLKEKDWTARTTRTMPVEEFLGLSDRRKQDFCSMLEMIYFRERDTDRGIYDIMNNFADKKNIKMDIVNRGIRAGLQKSELEKILAKKSLDSLSYSEKKDIRYGFSMDISFNL